MPRNGSGTYSLPGSVNPVITNTVITTAWANTTLTDVGNALTSSLDRNGSGGMLAALKLIDGLIGTPSLTFSNDTTAGLVRLGSNEFSVVIGGAELCTYQATLVDFLVRANFTRATSSYAPAAATDLVNKLYADNLAFSAALPSQTGNSGKFVRTDGATATWQDYDGPWLAVITATTTISTRNSYRIDSSGGSFNLNLPPVVADAWIKITDVSGALETNAVTLVRDGTDEIMNLSENLILDVPYADIKLRGTTDRGWVLAA